ncbi:MAG: hypothetical protein K2N44_01380 [Lachnospiraceae bacterium]|nr:hypothetical protein [Lachnospiraceae bacterium]
MGNGGRHIERGNEVDVLLQKAGVENVAAECAEIQDSEDFFVTDVCESGGRIVIDFEMPFILCVNSKYCIEVTAEGKLDIPNTESYQYDSHDFATMGKRNCCLSAAYAVEFCSDDDKLMEQVKFSISSFPIFFLYVSEFANCKDKNEEEKK